MKRARIFQAGRDQWAEAIDGDTRLRLVDGVEIDAATASYLPPAWPGATIFALGLNYADHSAELGFLKGYNSFVGHPGASPRPADANRMHPECELVAIIAKQANRVARADALAHVGGYTVTCDHAIREYLENYYRRKLRVKNRDATTPLGPWIVDAADVPDPQVLQLSTTVNGASVQHGSTRDMVFDVATLIGQLSALMTLMILTGTPHGVHFFDPGDEVVCEIGSIGRLVDRVRAA